MICLRACGSLETVTEALLFCPKCQEYWTEDELTQWDDVKARVRAEEREACAKVAENHCGITLNPEWLGETIAKAIRARGRK